jgi:hypothetical protein
MVMLLKKGILMRIYLKENYRTLVLRLSLFSVTNLFYYAEQYFNVRTVRGDGMFNGVIP